MQRRPGITLIEVLAAIFIMAIGMLALLVLFPLGALSMARAVRDDRAAAAGANAAALANAMDLRHLVAGSLRPIPGGGFALPDPNGRGYPVYVDPYYYLLPQGTQAVGKVMAGANKTPGVARHTVGYANSTDPRVAALLRARFFSFLDEMEFDKNGAPTGSSGIPTGSRTGGISGTPQTVNRPGTYTWAYLVRGTGFYNAPATQVELPLSEMAIVVYAGRNLSPPPWDATSRSFPGEDTFNNPSGTMGRKGENTLLVSYAPADRRPNVRKGTWLLDTTYATHTAAGTLYGSVNAFFYRVSNVTETSATAGGGTLTLELESDLKADVNTIVVMDSVVTVLERGTNWKP